MSDSTLSHDDRSSTELDASPRPASVYPPRIETRGAAGRPRSRARRYGFAVSLAIVSALLRWALVPVLGREVTYVIAFPAAFAAAAYGGVGPALVAAIVAMTGLFALLGVDVTSVATVVRTALFLVAVAATSGFAESLERERRRASSEARERSRAERSLAASQALAHVGSFEIELGSGPLEASPTRWSDEAYRILGIVPGDVAPTAKELYARIHPDDREAVRAALAKAIAELDTCELEHRIVRPDGTTRWVHQWAGVVVDERGRALRLLGTCQDVTERRQAELGLRERERLLALITDAAPALISYIDTDCRYLLSNGAYQRWFGQDPRELRGRHAREVLGEPAWRLVEPYLLRAIRGEDVSYDQHLEYPDGSTRWVHVTYTPDRLPDGSTRGVVVLVHDISESKRTETALVRAVEQSERLRRLATAFSEALEYEEVGRAIAEQALPAIEAASAVIAVLTPEGKELEIVSSTGADTATMHAWRRFPLDAKAPMAEAARTGTPVFVRDLDERAKRYPELPALVAGRLPGASASIPLVSAGRIIGVIGLGFEGHREFDASERDYVLTVSRHCAQAVDRARLYTAERVARAQAEAASGAKDEFLAMLGHELRNPLAPIVTALELMKQRGDVPATKERIVIERQAQHLVQLVDDLLDVSRIARGKLELKKAPIEVSQALAQAIEMSSPLFEQYRHRLDVDVPASGLRVRADETRLAQVFSNLLTNAAKYTSAGGHVRVSAGREGDRVVVRVRDDGVGIAPDLLPHIFDLFVQGPRGIDRSKGGLGLGLALVKNLVELHGGTVEARSEGLGKGTELVVRLPALEGAAASPSSEAARPRRPARAPHGLRVLVVDDNADAAEMLELLLERAGHETAVAHDGPESLELLGSFRPDVAILDLGLPVMDGYELAQRMRAALGDAAPVLIALTGYGQARDRDRTQRSGFSAHLVKPVDSEKLLATVAASARHDRPRVDA